MTKETPENLASNERISPGEMLLLTGTIPPERNGAYSRRLLPSPTCAEAIGTDQSSNQILVKQTINGLITYSICEPDTTKPPILPKSEVEATTDCKFLLFTNLQSKPYLYDQENLMPGGLGKSMYLFYPNYLFIAKTKQRELFTTKDSTPNPYRHPLADIIDKKCAESPRSKSTLYMAISQNDAGEDIVCGYGTMGIYTEFDNPRPSNIAFLMLTNPGYLDPEKVLSQVIYDRIQAALEKIPNYNKDYKGKTNKKFGNHAKKEKVEIIFTKTPRSSIHKVKPSEIESTTPFCCTNLSEALLAQLYDPNLKIKYKYGLVDIDFMKVRPQIFADIKNCLDKINLELAPLFTSIGETRISSHLFRAENAPITSEKKPILKQVTTIRFPVDISSDERALLALIKGTIETDNAPDHLYAIDESIQPNGLYLQKQESIQLELHGDYSEISVPSFPFRAITIDGETTLPNHNTPLWQNGSIDRLYVHGINSINTLLANMDTLSKISNNYQINIYFDDLETAKQYASLTPIYKMQDIGTYSNLKIYHNQDEQTHSQITLSRLERLAIRMRLGINPWHSIKTN